MAPLALRAAVLLGLPAASAAFQFLSIGDWGDPAAKKLNPWMGQTAPEFVIAIGDNFYSKGVKGTSDPQFEQKFEQTFTGDALNVSWYVASGNHDYYGGETGINAEIAYSKQSSRWTFPDYYYDEEITMKDGTTILVVATDTWRINGGDTFVKHDPVSGRMALHSKALVDGALASGKMDQVTYDTLTEHFAEEDPADPIPWCDPSPHGADPDKPTPCTKPHDQVQLDWLEKVLTESTADWKIVMGHFPIYSCTQHEHGESPKLIQYLDPILHKAHADMYFNGHDHILQHTKRGDVHYFGSGAGAQKHTGVNAKYEGLLGVHEGHYGFMIHEGNATNFKTIFVDDTGARPYNYTIVKPKNKTASRSAEPAATGLGAVAAKPTGVGVVDSSDHGNDNSQPPADVAAWVERQHKERSARAAAGEDGQHHASASAPAALGLRGQQ